MHLTLLALVTPVFAAVDAGFAALLVFNKAVIEAQTLEEHVVVVGVNVYACRVQSLLDLASVISCACMSNEWG